MPSAISRTMDNTSLLEQSQSDLVLRCIDLPLLARSNINEQKRLLEACEVQGFFYIDLSDDEPVLRDWTAILQLMQGYFHQAPEVKSRDIRQSDTHGYEPVATSAGAEDNVPDWYESLKASRDEIISRDAALTSLVSRNHELFLRFSNSAQEILMTILRTLDACLGQDSAKNLVDCHKDGQASLTNLAMFRYPAQESTVLGVGHNKHTDIGTLTFLLSKQPGLQVFSTESNSWKFVEPKPGHAVINVGDTLRFLSCNRLRSAIHRVTPVAKVQTQDRYSIAYFLRAGNDVEFEDSTGQVACAESWHNTKFGASRSWLNQSERVAVLTGGME